MNFIQNFRLKNNNLYIYIYSNVLVGYQGYVIISDDDAVQKFYYLSQLVIIIWQILITYI